MGIEPPARLGGDVDSLAAKILENLGYELLAATVTINVSRIDKGHAAIQRLAQRGQGIRLAHTPPIGTDRPGAKPDFRHVIACLA